MNRIRQLEEIALNARKSLQMAVYDGWLLCYANGYTRRSNSVQPLYPSTLPLPEKIAHCEAFYAARDVPTVFKLTDAAQPPGLDAALSEAGYTHTAQTLVLTRPLAPPPAVPRLASAALDVRTYASTIWLDTFCELNSPQPAHYSTARNMFLAMPVNPSYFALAWHGPKPIGIGILVVERGYAGVFDLGIHADYRRRGYGQRLMGSLLAIAQDCHAHTAYLQVAEDNTAARALYRHLGFGPAHTYWYRVQPPH